MAPATEPPVISRNQYSACALINEMAWGTRTKLPSEASPLCHHSRTNRFPLEMLAAGSLAGPNVAFVAATATAMLENWADLCSNSRLAAFAGIVGKIAWRAAKCPLAQWHLFYFSSSLGRIAFKLSRPLLGVLFPRAISKTLCVAQS